MKQKFLVVLLTIYNCIQLSAQTLDKKFASTDGPVLTTLQSGDTVYIGGMFSQVGNAVKGLARFKQGSTKPDADFPQLGPYNHVTAMESDSTGGFYLGGSFSSYNGAAIQQTSVIHVLSDGSLDNNFATVNTNNGSVNALKKRGNWLYVAGSFYNFQDAQRTNLAAVDATTGALDSWQPETPTLMWKG